MSYNIQIVAPPIPQVDAAAWEHVHQLLESEDEAQGEPAAIYLTLIDRLTAQYPCICDLPDDEVDDGVWSDGPLRDNAGRVVTTLGLSSRIEEAMPFIVKTANELGLVVFDEQEGKIHRPATTKQAEPRPAPRPSGPSVSSERIAYMLDTEPTPTTKLMNGRLDVSDAGVSISGPRPVKLAFSDIKKLWFRREPNHFNIILDAEPRVFFKPVLWNLFGVIQINWTDASQVPVYSALHWRLGGPGSCAVCSRNLGASLLPCKCGSMLVNPL